MLKINFIGYKNNDNNVNNDNYDNKNNSIEKRIPLLARRAYRLIEKQRMADVNIQLLVEELTDQVKKQQFNLYQFIKKYN